MQVRLTPRLEKIAQQVKKGSCVADIGTDHGYIPIYLIQNQIATRVIACDVNSKPLEIAEKNIQQYDLANYIETRLSDGLEAIEAGEADTIIIAGMGGILIQEIIEASRSVAATSKLILQPMQGRDVLRRYLVSSGFSIQKDLLVKEDHRIYEIIVAEAGQQSVADEIYFEIGFQLKENPSSLAKEFIEKKIASTENILLQLKNNKDAVVQTKFEETQERLRKLQEVLLWLKQSKRS